MKNIIKAFLTLIISIIFFNNANAQFYNGHQMNFGQNRVQYSEFEWLYYRYPKFDTYYYQQGKDLAQYTSDRVQQIIPEMEKFFGRTIKKRIIFLVFNRLTDFRQSNIGLKTEDVASNIGGVTKIIDNKVFLYFEKDHAAYDAQIREAIATLMINDMLYGTSLKNKVTNSMMISLPEWFQKGLAAYTAWQWNADIEDKIKDGITSKKFKQFNSLTGDDAKIAGYSLWYYINQVYGRDAIPGIIYLTGISKNYNNAFSQVLNRRINDLIPDWRDYYTEKFSKNSNFMPMPDSVKIVEKPRKSTVYDNAATSPDGKYTFYTTNILGKYKVFLRNNVDGGTNKILRREQKIQQITDYSFPVGAWHPSSKILSFVIEEESYVYLYQYNTEKETLNRKMLPKFDKVFSLAYSDDGLSMVMSVQIGGNIDIVVLNVGSGAFERITEDLADDINPRFVDNSTKIIFSSNRISDTLAPEKPGFHASTSNNYDLFIYDYKTKNKILHRVTNTKYENETSPFQVGKDSYTYLSDKNGIVNLYSSLHDSVIASIDTAVHYRFVNKNAPITNYEHNILSLNVTKNNKTDVIFRNNGRFSVLKTEQKNKEISNLNSTFFRAKQLRHFQKLDSLEIVKKHKAELEKQRIDSIVANPPKNLTPPDSGKINISNYIFEEEKNLAYQYIFYGENLKDRHTDQLPERPRQRLYFTTFYTDYLVSQVDFSSMNQSYQAFTGGPYYFNPGVNVFFKIGTKDLFEDYRITAAMRVGGNLDSYEYYFTFEDLKHRLDKQYIYHRYSYRNDYDYYVTKVITNEAIYALSWPFNQTSALKGSVGLRYDKAKYLVTDYQYLNQDPQYQVFAKAKIEYVFDNTISLCTNINSGLKYKVWSELYQQVEGRYDIISTIGCDFRYYQKLHRNLIFATRFAYGTSFGSGKIIYYLGGVDNWTKFTSNTASMFDQSIKIDQDENYIYQAVATNMRGFIQNCRNGNSFALINNEIRWPIFSYLANRPLNAKIINDFQVCGFFDAGTAWKGGIPMKADNAYNSYEVNGYPVDMTVYVDRPNIVCGYGFGFRTTILGYFMRFDWAWGVEGKIILPRVFYFSLGLDF